MPRGRITSFSPPSWARVRATSHLGGPPLGGSGGHWGASPLMLWWVYLSPFWLKPRFSFAQALCLLSCRPWGLAISITHVNISVVLLAGPRKLLGILPICLLVGWTGASADSFWAKPFYRSWPFWLMPRIVAAFGSCNPGGYSQWPGSAIPLGKLWDTHATPLGISQCTLGITPGASCDAPGIRPGVFLGPPRDNTWGILGCTRDTPGVFLGPPRDNTWGILGCTRDTPRNIPRSPGRPGHSPGHPRHSLVHPGHSLGRPGHTSRLGLAECAERLNNHDKGWCMTTRDDGMDDEETF